MVSARWIGVPIVLGVVAGACTISFPEYTLGSGGSSGSSSNAASITSSSDSSSSASTGSSSSSTSSSSSSSTSSSSSGGQPYVYDLGFPATAFDVSSDGSVVAVGQAGAPGSVQAVCFNPDGSVARSLFTIAGSPYDALTFSTFFDVDVARAGTGKQVAVSWHYEDSNQTAENRSVVLDASCNEVLTAGAHDLDTAVPSGIKRLGAVRASADGHHFVFFYDAHSIGQLRLVTYDETDTFKGARTVGAPCASGAHGRALGMNTGTGYVVAGCQDAAGKRYYQRFNAILAPVDSALLPASSLDTTGAATNGYLIDHNPAGNLVFVADPGSGTVWPALFVHPGLSPASLPDVTGLSNDHILSLSTGDFVLPLQRSTSNSQRYAPDGTETPSYADVQGTRFRVDGADRVYALAGTTITRTPPLW